MKHINHFSKSDFLGLWGWGKLLLGLYIMHENIGYT